MQQPELGKKILELRLAKGLTQGELAEKCNISVRTIQRIELADVTPRSYTIKIIFEALDYDIYTSFGKLSYQLDRIAYKRKKWLGQCCRYTIDLFNLKTNTMKKLTTLTAILSLIVVGVFFVSSKNKTQELEDVKQIIETKNQFYMNQFNIGNLEEAMSIYRSNACILPSNCCDRECFRQHLEIERSKGYKLTQVKLLSLSLADTIAVEKGQWKIEWPGGHQMTGMYMCEWHYAENEWEIVNDITGINSIIPEQ